MKDLVTLIGHTIPATGEFAYRAITPYGEYLVRSHGGYWGAVPPSGNPPRGLDTTIALGLTPEEAVRKALSRKVLAA